MWAAVWPYHALPGFALTQGETLRLPILLPILDVLRGMLRRYARPRMGAVRHV